MTLADWIDFNTENDLYHAVNEINVVGQKDGSYNSNDNVFELKVSQAYAKALFGQYEMMFFRPEVLNSWPTIRVLINIPTPEEVKCK